MTPLSQLLAAMAPLNGGYTVFITDDWRQGRNLYGGLSAALCVAAAERAFPDLPPLRSAQFAFLGPASGSIHAVPTLLRRGKSTVFIGVDFSGDAGMAVRALLCFATARPSALAHDGLPMPDVNPPDACTDFFGRPGAPNFAQHFHARLARGPALISAATDPDMLLWLRHSDADAGNGQVALVALADAAPPAAMTMFTAPAPISTMTWMIDILAEAPHGDPSGAPQSGTSGAPQSGTSGAPQSGDGWRLMRSTAETVTGGYSSQAMTIWSAAGTALLAARQCVAIFA